MPTAHDKTRIARHWAILLTLVRTRFGVTNAKLREQMGVSRHTIWRDLIALTEAGLPIEEHIENGERRYKLQTTDLPALTLQSAHVQALEVSRALLGALEGTALLDAYDDILFRVGRPPRARTLSAADERLVALRRLAELALRKGRRIEIEFVNVGQAVARPRRVDPQGWLYTRGELYLRAHDLERDAPRTFATSRIRRLEVLPEPAEHAPEPRESPWFLTGPDLTSLPVHEVEIRLSPIAAAHLAARPLHPTQVEHPEPDGTVRLTARVAGLWSTLEWLAAWGPEVRPLAPPELVELAVERARACVAAWGAE
jgi:proteasome accessory factor B